MVGAVFKCSTCCLFQVVFLTPVFKPRDAVEVLKIASAVWKSPLEGHAISLC